MHAELAHRVLKDARVQAFHTPLPSKAFCGGLVLTAKDERLAQRRGNKPSESYAEHADYPNKISGEMIYGGPIHGTFGHFMAEMVHRIVPSRLLHGRGPFLFATFAGDRKITSFDTLPAYKRDVLALLGVQQDDLRLISENTIVEQLFVAEQGSELQLGPKPGYLADLHDYVTPRLDALHRQDTRPAKVHVSRSRLVKGLLLGERYLEEQLVKEGFTIVYPETLPVTVQMDIYRKAEILVFSEGSACHGVELLGTGSLRRCYLLARRDKTRSFELVLRPRADEFATSTGHHFLGTMLERKSPTTGVTLFDPDELVAFFRANRIAALSNFNRSDYFSAAQRDLQRYLRRHALGRSRIARWIMRRVGLGRKLGRIKPHARRELIEAFRQHAGS